MKKIENSFAVTGRICRDAEIHLFEIVKVAHFSIVVSRIGKINEPQIRNRPHKMTQRSKR